MEIILVKNEEELEKLREKDGGPKYQSLAYEGMAKGWITVGCKFHLQCSEEQHWSGAKNCFSGSCRSCI